MLGLDGTRLDQVKQLINWNAGTWWYTSRSGQTTYKLAELRKPSKECLAGSLDNVS